MVDYGIVSTPTVKGEFFLPSIAIPDWSLSNLGVEKNLGELRGFAENFFERCGQGRLEKSAIVAITGNSCYYLEILGWSTATTTRPAK